MNYNCEHDLIAQEDTDQVKWCGYTMCTKCQAIVSPDGVIFCKGTQFMGGCSGDTELD